ncbi:FimV [Idiomarina sp. A28L]|uniref:FimV/HubP family polar landmark protein n=1 Tax=Idiomarina sp. A28L TaxID=1036674 RepID=UPI0002138E6B|nr:FimV/HubP family polar landmark protein [Idiomarina sp. A28L]EGN76306.1 FimV [Idiomarina sp. A28L]
MTSMQQQISNQGASLRWVALALLVVALAFSTASMAQDQLSEQNSKQTYGPVAKQDTMWFIANRIHPDRSVSIYQTMAALVDANPELFPEDNINRLATGVMLYVPSASDIRAQNAERARERMIPLLGGEFAAAALASQARVNVEELQAQHNEALNEVEQQLNDTQRDLRGVTRENEALQEQVAELETALGAAEAALAARTEQTPAQRRQVEREVETVYEPSLAWFIGWPGIVIPLAFIGLIFAFLVVALRKNVPSKKSDSPYKAATAVHLAETQQHKEAVAAAEPAEVEPKTEQPEHPQEPVDSYREISDILDEAEADADADSDLDAGQTQEEAALAKREELAAQIDLSRAYLEMGEHDEAIAALEEVMPVADSELQAEAEQLLEKIKEQK